MYSFCFLYCHTSCVSIFLLSWVFRSFRLSHFFMSFARFFFIFIWSSKSQIKTFIRYMFMKKKRIQKLFGLTSFVAIYVYMSIPCQTNARPHQIYRINCVVGFCLFAFTSVVAVVYFFIIAIIIFLFAIFYLSK